MGRGRYQSRHICAGKGWTLLYETGTFANVKGFHDEFNEIKDVPISTVATAYDASWGETLVLVANEALFFGDKLETSLLPPQQICDNGLMCDPMPKQFTNGKSIHGIYDPQTEILLPLQLHGCISYLPIRTPTEDELKNCRQIELTSDREWNPYSDRFLENEKSFNNHLQFTQNVSNTLRNVAATSSKEHRSTVDAAKLARRWGTNLEVAAQTLKVTTQRGIRIVQGPFTRRLQTRQAQLGSNYLRCPVFSDTLFSDVTSVRGYKCAQIFTTAENHAKVYPMKTKADAYKALDYYSYTVGIPNPIVTDNAGEEYGQDWKRVTKKYLMYQRWTEPHSPWQNKAELEIQGLKTHFRRIMNRNKCPEIFWCFGMEYTAEIRERMARNICDGKTPMETTTGESVDISEYTEFDFYGWIKFHDLVNDVTENELGNWLGVAKNVGSAMCFYVLKKNGKILSRSTVRNLFDYEWTDENEKVERMNFDKAISEKYGTFDETLIHNVRNDEMEEPMFQNDDDATNNTNDENENISDIDTPKMTHVKHHRTYSTVLVYLSDLEHYLV